MEYTNTQSADAALEANRLFVQATLFQGQRLLDLGRVNPSFKKGTFDTAFVFSGIVNDNNTAYESKITRRLVDEQIGPLTSTCNCKLWTAEDHCPHAAALYLKLRTYGHSNEHIQSGLSNIAVIQEGVVPERYGTLVKTAGTLQGARANSTFSMLSYTLTGRKVKAFPVPTRWFGRLIIDIVPTHEVNDWKDLPMAMGRSFVRFSWKPSEEQTEVAEISLFDTLYLFNWQNGEAHELTGEIIDFCKRLKLQDQWHSTNEWLRLCLPYAQKNDFELRIAGKPWQEFATEEANIRISINNSARKSFLNLNIELYDYEQRLTVMPDILRLFATEGGHASSFRTKNDAVTFLRHLVEDFVNDSVTYRKYIHGTPKKQLITELADSLLSDQEALWFDDIHQKIFFLPAKLIRRMAEAIQESLTDIAWRTSFDHQEDRKISLQIPKNILLQGIQNLYTRLLAIKVPLFYNEQLVRTWKSAIRFERNRDRLDWFELDLVVDKDDMDIIRQADVPDNFIITDKGLVLLTDKEKDLLRFMKRYTRFEGEKKDGQGENAKRFGLLLQRSRIFELFELKKLGIEGALTSEEELFCEKIMTLQEMPTYPLPERYQELARPYQVTGFHWLRFLWEHRFGACLADDMGLGKTLQTIMFLQSIEKDVKRILIICPVSILYNWKNELEKFSNLKFGIYYGEDREIPPDTKVILTSYGLMKKESFSTFSTEEFDVLVFDEVQHLKNIRSLGANAARQLKAKFRICLTGTPVENDLSEFYNIMDIAIPGVWGDLGLVRSSSKSKSRLLARKTVKPFILRRTKEQVLKELPEKIENHVFLEFSEAERQAYQGKLDNLRNQMLNPAFAKRYGEILKGLLELRQMCLWQRQGGLSSTKVEFLLENLEQLMEEGHKVLIFSQFTTYLDIIQDKIREHSWKFARIDGSQTIKKRTEQVEYFQQGDAQIFLISLKAGGFGLNLTAASYIFLMDPWWNPAVERQAIDRAHRIGQENHLTVYRPIIKDSVEEKVLLLQQAKRELFRDLMAEDEDDYFSGRLTMTDFQHLLS